MAASKKHAVGKARVMSRARWDSLSEGDKWDIYSGVRPGSKKAKSKVSEGGHSVSKTKSKSKHTAKKTAGGGRPADKQGRTPSFGRRSGLSRASKKR